LGCLVPTSDLVAPLEGCCALAVGETNVARAAIVTIAIRAFISCFTPDGFCNNAIRPRQATAVCSFPNLETVKFAAGPRAVIDTRTNKEHRLCVISKRNEPMSPQPHSNIEDDELETAVDQAISACGGDTRATIRALIVANEYLESEVAELMKAVSRAYARGRFKAYSG